jgi:hypothetical protein
MAPDPQKRVKGSSQEAQAGPLVPLYGAAEIVRGIQAFRRGDQILYTIRGEPRQVLELMGQLDRQGVPEVLALISHAAQPAPADGSQEDAEGTEE